MAEQNFTVRPLKDGDLDGWLALRRHLWDEVSEDEHKGEMMDILDHTDSQFVVIAESGDGRLIGFLEASIRPFVEDCQTDHVGYLEGWFVEPEFRMHGVGRALVKSAENWARKRGCTEMASDAEIGNDLSLKAHQKLGYGETSRLVHLRKELGQR
jgi:aminoglycoside 6'-N-acetyltransferase I